MESLRGLSSSPASAYDELVTGQKSIRYHWQGILSVIRALPGGLGERVESARRQLEESGATVNLLDDRGAPRWAFDPLPFVVTPDEWSEIESGVVQRARLLDAVLADVYGPQTLLQDQLLPPMLVHANRHFQRPCRVTDGKAPPRYLAHYAVDLVRLSDGRWHVLADHTEVPSGIGYAIEMRRVLARSLPEAFRSIPGAAPPALRRPLARFAARHGAGRHGPAQHGGADAGFAVDDLFRACLPLARARRAAGRRRRPGGARWRRLDQDPGRPAAGAHAAAPPRQLVRRSARAARRFRARRHRPGRGHAHRRHLARQCPGLRRGRDAGHDAVPRAAERKAARPALATAVARRVVAGRARRAHLCARQPRPDDRAALPGGRPRTDHRRHAGAGRAQGAGGAHPRPARPLRGAVSRDALAQPEMGRQQPGAGRHGDARVRERRGRLLSRAAGRPGARAGGRHLPALARPAERHAEGRLGAGRGRRRRAAPLDAALPPGRRRAQRCRPAKPRRRQSLLARPLYRAPRQRRPPAAHHGDQGGDRRGEPARRPRTAPAGTPAEPGQPDGPGFSSVGTGERRLPAGPRSGGDR